jgi:hypothetical protein
MFRMIRLLVRDDHELTRKGVAQYAMRAMKGGPPDTLRRRAPPKNSSLRSGAKLCGKNEVPSP